MHPEEWKKSWIPPQIKHGEPTKYGWVVLYPEHFKLGKYTDIAWGCFVNARYGVTIEENVQIGPFTSILSDNSINNTHGPITIKGGANIGAYSLILPNVIIENGEFVKAYSIRK